MMLPDDFTSLGPTVAIKANGAISHLSITPRGLNTLLREMRTGRYDVVHVHEPVAPLVGWGAAGLARLPLVGTFHAYSESHLSNGIANFLGARRMLQRLRVRIAVSEAAAWTGRRWFGGQYRIIPNGVKVDRRRAGDVRGQPRDRLRIVFVGQPVERKGLPVLLQAINLVRKQLPVELVMVGPSPDLLPAAVRGDPRITALGQVTDEAKQRELECADILCAPSLGGESFGMVLTEAFAAGTPVIASDIPGYRDVVRHGVNGILVQPADALVLACAIRNVWSQPHQLAQMSRAAADDADRYAWPRIAMKVFDAYHDAIAPRPSKARSRLPRSTDVLDDPARA